VAGVLREEGASFIAHGKPSVGVFREGPQDMFEVIVEQRRCFWSIVAPPRALVIREAFRPRHDDDDV
jgi:hypothetical protein